MTKLRFLVAFLSSFGLLLGIAVPAFAEEGRYYANGWLWDSNAQETLDALGVSGELHVYDVDVHDPGFVCGWVNVTFSTNPLYWIQAGWVKSTGAGGVPDTNDQLWRLQVSVGVEPR